MYSPASPGPRAPIPSPELAGKCAPGGIRTHTPSVEYRVLYSLSYRGPHLRRLLLDARQDDVGAQLVQHRLLPAQRNRDARSKPLASSHHPGLPSKTPASPPSSISAPPTLLANPSPQLPSIKRVFTPHTCPSPREQLLELQPTGRVLPAAHNGHVPPRLLYGAAQSNVGLGGRAVGRADLVRGGVRHTWKSV